MQSSVPEKVLVFRVDTQLCALPVNCIREVLHRPELVSAPGQPAILEGFLNLHGEPYPVISVRRLFGLPPAPTDLYAPLMLVDLGSLHAVFEADDIETVAETSGTLRPFDANASPNECALGMLSAAGPDGEQFEVTLLSCQRMLLARETACLAEMRSKVQERLKEVGALAG